jgi:hypothetical protein
MERHKALDNDNVTMMINPARSHIFEMITATE